MKKRILITNFTLFIIIIMLVGCFELAGVPESDEEAKELDEWSEEILNRVKVTVLTTVDVYDSFNESYLPDKQVCVDILATEGYRGRWCRDTKENGFVSFDPVTIYLNDGGEISVTADTTGTYDRTLWLSYYVAKDKATFTNETGYTYSWSPHFSFNIE